MENNHSGHQSPLLPCSTLTFCHWTTAHLQRPASAASAPSTADYGKVSERKILPGRCNSQFWPQRHWRDHNWFVTTRQMKWQMTSSCQVSYSQLTRDQPCQIKHNGREGEVLDKDTAGEEDLKQVTLRSCSKIWLQPSMMEEGAAGVEHCGKCSLHTGMQGRRSALRWLGWWFLFAMSITSLGLVDRFQDWLFWFEQQISFLFSDKV